MAALEKEVRERSEKDKKKEQQEEEEPIITPGMGGRLMITQGNGLASASSNHLSCWLNVLSSASLRKHLHLCSLTVG
jgi:hypothetical protein